MNWELIYSSDSPVTADIIRDMLEVNGVNAVIMNKQDSAYTVLGHFEVMVPEEQAAQAKQLLIDHGDHVDENRVEDRQGLEDEESDTDNGN
ncbi:DUF2007 domain-containing protein [Haoranjiania flava]|uniref:DUF2007 domain-containing protein n=1 Tax=Haoranjiania flava TaxID=1856322 RepID=A0AAE3LL95_9BACT|nr:DUF2007 domain-containing protein [Haoranjiania flava]MCU7695144.1 DUF2007 domain-containing protein [Haoranjiania flava]